MYWLWQTFAHNETIRPTERICDSAEICAATGACAMQDGIDMHEDVMRKLNSTMMMRHGQGTKDDCLECPAESAYWQVYGPQPK